MKNKTAHSLYLKQDDNAWRKCNHCGKFISYKQMEEKKDVMFHFIPDTEFTIEETYWTHKRCFVKPPSSYPTISLTPPKC